MRTKTAQKISDALLIIRDSYYAKSKNQPFSKFKLDTAKQYIDEICIYIEHNSPDIEREFLFSCLGTLDELIEQDQSEKISEFAHAIRRVPFIFSGEEKWDKTFKQEYIMPFCDMYGDECFSEILEMDVPDAKKSAKGASVGGRTIYRYNKSNIMSLPAYFCFRLLIPLIVLPFLIGMMIYISIADYSPKNLGERYEITVDSFEYEHEGLYDYLYISNDAFEHQFEIARFFELSNSPEKVIELCESHATIVVYADYVTPRKADPHYKIIQLEDTEGNVYRSYEHTNQMDNYVLNFLVIAFLVFFIPSLAIFIMMLLVAMDPQRYVDHPRYVKFLFPDYSLQLNKKKKSDKQGRGR